MNGFAKTLLAFLVCVGTSWAGGKPTVKAVFASEDVPLNTDASTAFWRSAGVASLEKNTQGEDAPNFHGEVRMRWTRDNLYFLFICPYDELYLKPAPTTRQETNELWKWDVAEVFISANFRDIKLYKEFEVSPQGEWVDLDIDLHKPHHEVGWTWNSGFEKTARIDNVAHRWYAALRIPFSAIDHRSAKAENTFRMNLFLSEGPPSNHREITWQPPMSGTFHTPERFGLLQLVKEKQ